MPTAPPTVARHSSERELLLLWLEERDVPCPRCGYNLRNLTQPVCPECREELRLTVGVAKLRFEWLIAAIAPGIFSGIAALLLAIPIITVPLTGGGTAPWQLLLIDAFGWLSGLLAIGLFLWRHRFLRLETSAQVSCAAVTWTIHIIAFLIVIAWIV